MTNDSQRLIWVGPSQRPEVTDLLHALEQESMQVDVVEDPTTLVQRIQQSTPRAILLGPEASGESVCLAVRMHAEFSLVPILWLHSDLNDLFFAEAFGVGGDDVLCLENHEGLVRRLKLLPEGEPGEQGEVRGMALLGEPDDQRRIVLARLLRNARFDVSFAGNMDELRERLRSSELALVVVDSDLPGGDVLAELAQWRGEGGKAPWVVATPPKRLRETSAALKRAERAWVWDSFAPPENLLYAANEALRGSFSEQRASPRLLYGTMVGFRLAGRDLDDHGFLYNISGEGLFIRTLAPFSSGDDVWLEFKPPRTDRRVRLDAKVVWRKIFGRVSEATVPPGFGIQITGGSRVDMKRYRDGYRALAEHLVGIRFSAYPSTLPEPS